MKWLIASVLFCLLSATASAHLRSPNQHILTNKKENNYALKLPNTFTDNYFHNQEEALNPVLDVLLSSFKFASVPNVIPSKLIHSTGGNLNLLLLQKNGLDLQAGGGVVYFPLQTPQPGINNTFIHPNVDISIGYSF